MKTVIKLEDNFCGSARLLDDLEYRMAQFMGGQVDILDITNNDDHWLYVVWEPSETLVELEKVVITEQLIYGFVVGFLEANRITCI